jgi:hypothetical protein
MEGETLSRLPFLIVGGVVLRGPQVTQSENLGYFGKSRHCKAPQEPWQSMPL